MVQIGAPPRVHMRHQIEYAMALQHPLPGDDGDVVAGLDRDRGIVRRVAAVQRLDLQVESSTGLGGLAVHVL